MVCWRRRRSCTTSSWSRAMCATSNAPASSSGTRRRLTDVDPPGRPHDHTDITYIIGSDVYEDGAPVRASSEFGGRDDLDEVLHSAREAAIGREQRDSEDLRESHVLGVVGLRPAELI